MEKAFIIISLIASLISLTLLSARFSSTFKTHKVLKVEETAIDTTPNLKGWVLLLGLLLALWIVTIILVSIFIDKSVSISLGVLVAIIITLFDGEKTDNIPRMIKYNKIAFILSISLYTIFLVFAILVKLLA